MSAANTGQPAAATCSAISCSVRVLPVPVAPAMRPWRLRKRSGIATSTAGVRRGRVDEGAPQPDGGALEAVPGGHVLVERRHHMRITQLAPGGAGGLPLPGGGRLLEGEGLDVEVHVEAAVDDGRGQLAVGARDLGRLLHQHREAQQVEPAPAQGPGDHRHHRALRVAHLHERGPRARTRRSRRPPSRPTARRPRGRRRLRTPRAGPRRDPRRWAGRRRRPAPGRARGPRPGAPRPRCGRRPRRVRRARRPAPRPRSRRARPPSPPATSAPRSCTGIHPASPATPERHRQLVRDRRPAPAPAARRGPRPPRRTRRSGSGTRRGCPPGWRPSATTSPTTSAPGTKGGSGIGR